jgi:hypothetical protein
VKMVSGFHSRRTSSLSLLIVFGLMLTWTMYMATALELEEPWPCSWQASLQRSWPPLADGPPYLFYYTGAVWKKSFRKVPLLLIQNLISISCRPHSKTFERVPIFPEIFWTDLTHCSSVLSPMFIVHTPYRFFQHLQNYLACTSCIDSFNACRISWPYRFIEHLQNFSMSIRSTPAELLNIHDSTPAEPYVCGVIRSVGKTDLTFLYLTPNRQLWDSLHLVHRLAVRGQFARSPNLALRAWLSEIIYTVTGKLLPQKKQNVSCSSLISFASLLILPAKLTYIP